MLTRKTTLRTVSAVAILAVASCTTVQNNPNTTGGVVAGAAAGALLGTLAGGNDARNALIGAGIGALAGGAVGQYLDQRKRALEADLAGTGATVTNTGDRLIVNLPSNVTFATDSATLAPEFRPVLANVAASLNEDPRSLIDVIGHTDSTGSTSYNQDLSERRANSVTSALLSNGVDRRRVASYGVGETQPITTNSTASGRAQNRRVEITITPATS
ncbi:MAG: OmpA family protein [Pseudomonadota bacterium]